MTITEAKKEYNNLLQRFNKANVYFENKNIGNEEKEVYLKDYKGILKGLNYYLSKIEVYETNQVLEGFKI